MWAENRGDCKPGPFRLQAVTGRQLNQDDHDLLMQLVKMGSHKPLGEYTTVPAYAILTALGRKTGGDQYRQLSDDITRLVAATVKLSNPDFEYIGHLVDDAAQDKNSRYWIFKFNPKLRTLYDVLIDRINVVFPPDNLSPYR